MNKFLKFYEFEKAANLLEEYTFDELNHNPALMEGLDASLVESVNSSLTKLDEGMFDWLKNWITKGIPGTILNKANKILDNYSKVKYDTLELIGGERNKMYKAKIEADKSKDQTDISRFEEIKVRAEKAIKVIEGAEEDKTNAIKKQLELLGNKAKTERVKSFIALKLAQIQEKIAGKKLEDAKKFADEDELKKLESEFGSAKQEVKKQEGEIKLVADKEGAKPDDKKAPDAVKKEDPKKDEVPVAKEEPKKEAPSADKKAPAEEGEFDPKDYPVGSKWEYTKDSGEKRDVEVTKDKGRIFIGVSDINKKVKGDTRIHVRKAGTHSQPYDVQIDRLKAAA